MTSTLTVEASSPVVGFGQEQAAQVVSTFLLVIMHVGHSQVSEDFWNNWLSGTGPPSTVQRQNETAPVLAFHPYNSHFIIIIAVG